VTRLLRAFHCLPLALLACGDPSPPSGVPEVRAVHESDARSAEADAELPVISNLEHSTEPSAAASPTEAAPPAVDPDTSPPTPTSPQSPSPPTAPEEATAAEPVPQPEPGVAAAEPVQPALDPVERAAEPEPVDRALSPEEPFEFATLERRLRKTKALGLFTKLALKNQIDDLLERVRKFHRRGGDDTTRLRDEFELLLLKLMTLLQKEEAGLAADIATARGELWAILVDPARFAELEAT
jgi:hypothetical protein